MDKGKVVSGKNPVGRPRKDDKRSYRDRYCIAKHYGIGINDLCVTGFRDKNDLTEEAFDLLFEKYGINPRLMMLERLHAELSEEIRMEREKVERRELEKDRGRLVRERENRERSQAIHHCTLELVNRAASYNFKFDCSDAARYARELLSNNQLFKSLDLDKITAMIEACFEHVEKKPRSPEEIDREISDRFPVQ